MTLLSEEGRQQWPASKIISFKLQTVEIFWETIVRGSVDLFLQIPKQQEVYI